MAEVVEPPPWLERWNRLRIGIAGGLGALVPLGGLAFVPLAGDVVLVAASVGIAGLGAWAFRERTRLDGLPLVLGDCAVRQVVGGEPALRVRTWLGHGRRFQDPTAVARLALPGGQEVPLAVDIPTLVASGPLTLTLQLPPLARGTVHLEVFAVEDGVRWSAEKAYSLDGVVNGPLDVPIRREGRRLAWNRSAWDRPLSGG